MKLLDLFFFDMNHNTRLAEEINNLLQSHMVPIPDGSGHHRRQALFWLHAHEFDIEFAIQRLEEAELVTPAGSEILRHKVYNIEKLLHKEKVKNAGSGYPEGDRGEVPTNCEE